MPAFMIGINPPEEVRSEIYRLKKRIIERVGYQQQVNEPPHCTLVGNNFSTLADVDNALKNLASEFSPFDVEVNGIACFPPEQSGTYTTYATIRKTKELEDLQRRVVNGTSQFKQGCLLQEYLKRIVPDYKYKPEELDNIKKYGYLYVGENWIPHITIAILSPETFGKIGDKLTKTEIQYTFPLSEITLFTYKDKWHPFKAYKLGE